MKECGRILLGCGLALGLMLGFTGCGDDDDDNGGGGGGGGAATINGSLAAGDQVVEGTLLDGYTLTGASGTTTVTLRSNAFDSFLVLFNEGLALMLADDDSGGGATGFDAQIVFEAQAGVAYTVIASSFGEGETGAYTLTTSSGTLTPTTVVLHAGPVGTDATVESMMKAVDKVK